MINHFQQDKNNYETIGLRLTIFHREISNLVKKIFDTIYHNSYYIIYLTCADPENFSGELGSEARDILSFPGGVRIRDILSEILQCELDKSEFPGGWGMFISAPSPLNPHVGVWKHKCSRE